MRKRISILCIGILLAGCRTRYVPAETVRTEYNERVNKVFVTDSTVSDRLVRISGDTVRIETTRDRWHTRTQHDTIRLEKTDTIRIPYPVEKKVEVERKRSRWEKVLLWVGIAVTIASIGLLWRGLRLSKQSR